MTRERRPFENQHINTYTYTQFHWQFGHSSIPYINNSQNLLRLSYKSFAAYCKIKKNSELVKKAFRMCTKNNSMQKNSSPLFARAISAGPNSSDNWSTWEQTTEIPLIVGMGLYYHRWVRCNSSPLLLIVLIMWAGQWMMGREDLLWVLVHWPVLKYVVPIVVSLC